MPTPSDPKAAPEGGKNTLNIAPENSAFNDLQHYLMNTLCTPGCCVEHPMNEKGE